MIQKTALCHSPALKALLFVVCLALVIFVVFRTQFLTGFNLLGGDRYDAVIVSTTLEHWFNTLKGVSNWSQTNYFYPYKNTLGHTDGYFIFGLIYSIFRQGGLDPFLSTTLVNVTTHVIGFVSFFAACRIIFGFKFGWALLAAMLFILNNGNSVHIQRLQLASIAFAPIMAILLWQTCQSLYANRPKQLALYGMASGIAYGAWCLTCFYIAWFFLYFTVFLFTALLLTAEREKLKLLWQRLKSCWLPVALVLLVAVLSLVPLLSVYLPKAQETGMRPYDVVLGYTATLPGVLQVGPSNFMFGALYNKLLGLVCHSCVLQREYDNTGIAVILFALFIGGCAFLLKSKEARGRNFERALCIATIVTWILSLKFLGHSAWYLVYHLFPGAKALHVVAIYQMFLAAPVIMIGLIYLSSASSRIPTLILCVLVSLLLVEELNTAYVALDRQQELKRVAITQPPPKECSSFFVTVSADQSKVTGMPEWINNSYAHNVTAMLIAELVHLPTINGIASFNPPDWDFAGANKSDYIERIKRYATKHKITHLCELDLDTFKWMTSY